MKVKELIEKLKDYPEEMRVVRRCSEPWDEVFYPLATVERIETVPTSEPSYGCCTEREKEDCFEIVIKVE